jgi:hypothetical protein
MKLLYTLLLTSLSIIRCIAQSSHIGSPAPGTSISPNRQITVQVVRPVCTPLLPCIWSIHQSVHLGLLQNSIMGSTEVGMVIGLLQCQQDPCPPPNAQLGNIVFNGQFSPQLHSDKPGEPYQNFTITVPAFQSNFGTTKAQLATARFHLIGVCFAITFQLLCGN